eukprot:m.41937 g.41937  ORF g.41937 m.41937 type:complete len:101 (+) comp12844_c0_seq55:183-485(+)
MSVVILAQNQDGFVKVVVTVTQAVTLTMARHTSSAKLRVQASYFIRKGLWELQFRICCVEHLPREYLQIYQQPPTAIIKQFPFQQLSSNDTGHCSSKQWH